MRALFRFLLALSLAGVTGCASAPRHCEGKARCGECADRADETANRSNDRPPRNDHF